jgi:NADH-quinone oxidoreductase subunit L
VPAAHAHEIHEHAHHLATWLSLAVAGTGILLAVFLYLIATGLPARIAAAFPTVHAFLMANWRFDDLYRQVPVLLTLDLSHASAWFDRNVVDRTVNAVGSLGRAVALVAGAFDNLVVDGLVNGVANTTAAWGRSLRRIQNGQLQAYVALLAWGAIGLVAWQVIAAGPTMPDLKGFDPLFFLDIVGLRSR